MASPSNTVLSVKEFSNDNVMKIIEIQAIVDTDDGAIATTTLTHCAGKRLRGCKVVNSPLGLTAGADLDVTDTFTGVNLTATNGDNCGGNGTAFSCVPDTADILVIGNLTVTITGNSVTYGTPLVANGELVVGTYYEIVAQSDLDFTTKGAADNTAGTRFFATATGTLAGDDSVKAIAVPKIYIVLV